jgi:hypothetical protein
MTSILSRRILSSSIRKNAYGSSIDRRNNQLYQQKRYGCFPCILSGGLVGMFAVTQIWNPYFNRGDLYILMSTSVLMTIIGFIID